MKIVIQDTWTEEDDLELLEYVEKNHELVTLSEEELLKITDVNEYGCIFCDSVILQQILKNIYTVNQCYPECFAKLYNRNIKVMNSNELYGLTKPFFVKPYSNDKTVDSSIINTNSDIDYIEKNIKVYTSSICNFINEYRIFVSNKEVYSIVDSSSFIMDNPVFMDCPKDFIEEIVTLNIYDFCVIDIGFDKLIKKWSVVEVNPPFSLSSYDLDIRKYFEYCVNAYSYITNKKTNK